MANCLDTLGTLVGGAAVLAVVLVALFRYGSSIGEWFSQLAAENRKLFWAAVGLACWTGVVGVVLFAVSLLSYIICIARRPDTLGSCTVAATLGTILPLAAAAVILGGFPWPVFIGVVRTLRWWRARTVDGREQSQ
jgi:hypothetical protein